MARRLFVLVNAGLLTVGLVMLLSAQSVSAAGPTITAGSGSHLSCDITGKAKVSPGLKDNWEQLQHTSDPNPLVQALPDKTFSANGPVSVKVKGSGSCTGTITDGTHTVMNPSLTFTLSVDPSHPGSTDPATCSAFNTNSPPNTALYDTTLKWKSPSATITPTTVTDSSESWLGEGPVVNGGTIAGSFAGGTAGAATTVDSTTLSALLQGPPSSTSPVPAFPQCQPTLKIGAHSAKLKAPKGLKKFSVVSPSTFVIVS